MFMTIRHRMRMWALRKLGGTDRRSAAAFSSRFLQSNGVACLVVTEDDQKCVGRTFTGTPGTVAVAVAPWANGLVIDGCSFVSTEPQA